MNLIPKNERIIKHVQKNLDPIDNEEWDQSNNNMQNNWMDQNVKKDMDIISCFVKYCHFFFVLTYFLVEIKKTLNLKKQKTWPYKPDPNESKLYKEQIETKKINWQSRNEDMFEFSYEHHQIVCEK